MAPNFIEIVGNSTEKRRFLSRNACQQRQRSSEKAAHRVLRACNDALVCLSGSARDSVAVMALISKFLYAKSRDFRPQNCAISAPNARSTHHKRAQKHLAHSLCRATHTCDCLYCFCKRWARVARKNGAEFHRNCRELNRKTQVSVAECVPTKTAELRKSSASCVASMQRCVGVFVWLCA